jgi:hypothetical protein
MSSQPLLDGRMSPADFRVELHDLAGPDQTAGSTAVPATDAPQGAPEAHEADAPGQEPEAPAEPAQAAPTGDEPGAKAAADAQQAKPAKRKAKAKAAKPGKVAPTAKPTPRAGTKQAKLIDLLKRPEGATVEQIAAATGWQHHTIRGAISGALKKKLGLTVEAIRTREVGPNKTGAKGSSTVYRIVG